MFGNVLARTLAVPQGVASMVGAFLFSEGGRPYKKVIFSFLGATPGSYLEFEAFCILEEMALFISYFLRNEMRKTFCRPLSLEFSFGSRTLLSDYYSLFFYFHSSCVCFFLLVGRPLNWQVCCAKFFGDSLAATPRPIN